MIIQKIPFLLIILVLTACTSSEPIGRLLVNNTNKSPIAAPVSFSVPKNLTNINEKILLLQEKNSQKRNPLQLDNESAQFLLLPAKNEQQIDSFSVFSGSSDVKSKLEIQDDGTSLMMLNEEKPVLSYVYSKINVPGRKDSIYARSGFVHPLWAPSGAVLSRIHPEDHLHHLGLWHPWTKVTFRNREIDFWNLGKGQGTVSHKKIISKISGPVFSNINAEQTFLEMNNENTQPVLNEQIDIRLWNIPLKDGYLIDYTIKQQCAVQDSVRLEQYRYGGFGFRAAAEWTGSNRHYLSSEGNDIKTADGSRARWCLVWGNTSQGLSTILFMSHPDNREHPEPLRIWGEWTDDTFFNFCPIKQKSITLYPEESYIQKFRIYIVTNTIQAETAEAIWQAFAAPPQVKYVHP